MSTLQAVTTASFEAEVLLASNECPVLVDFWAPWCAPCRMLGPVLEQVANEHAGRLNVVKLNTDEEPQVAARFQIRSIPAVKLFSGGKVIAEFVGAQPLGAVREFLAAQLPGDGAAPLQAARALRAAGKLGGAADALREIVAAVPQDSAAVIELAQVLALTGDAAGAREWLGRLSPAQQSDAAVKNGYALAHMAQVALSPDETDAIQDGRLRAARALLRGDLDSGLDALLALMQRNRRYATGQGREDLLHAFNLADAGDERITRARRRLAALLH